MDVFGHEDVGPKIESPLPPRRFQLFEEPDTRAIGVEERKLVVAGERQFAGLPWFVDVLSPLLKERLAGLRIRRASCITPFSAIAKEFGALDRGSIIRWAAESNPAARATPFQGVPPDRPTILWDEPAVARVRRFHAGYPTSPPHCWTSQQRHRCAKRVRATEPILCYQVAGWLRPYYSVATHVARHEGGMLAGWIVWRPIPRRPPLPRDIAARRSSFSDGVDHEP